MEKKLSRAEMESLLAAADSAAPPDTDSPSPAASRASSKTGRAAPAKRRASAKPRAASAPATPALSSHRSFDNVLAPLRERHAQFVQHASGALTSALRIPVDLCLANVIRDTFASSLRKLERTACVCFARAEPMGEIATIHCDAAILFPLIDRLLGGRGDCEPDQHRALTAIELSLASRIFRLLLAEWRNVWAELGNAKLEIVAVDTAGPEPTRLECDPRWVEKLPPGEAVVRIECELTAGAARGKAAFCVPWRVAEQMAACNQRATPPVADDSRPTVQAVVELAHTSLAADELAGLQVGDIIATDTDHASPLVVRVDGAPRFLARPGAYKGRKAVCIESAIEPPQE